MGPAHHFCWRREGRERGPTLLIVAVHCSQMVSSSMSSTWRGHRKENRVWGSGSPHTWVGNLSFLTLSWPKPSGLAAVSPETSVFHLQRWTSSQWFSTQKCSASGDTVVSGITCGCHN